MSEPTTKRVKVSKPEKKKGLAKPSTTPIPTTLTSNTETSAQPSSTDEPLLNIPAPKKKKERRVKTEADILAKQERKKARLEAEAAKKAIKTAAAQAKAKVQTIQNKTPKWKQFLVNTDEVDNAEKFKDTSYKVKGDDGSGDESSSDSDSDDEDEKKKKKTAVNKNDDQGKKRKAVAEADKGKDDKANKKGKTEHSHSKATEADLKALDTSTPGLAYLVEWKRSKATWKFQKLRQVWLINHMYDDKQLPSTHWAIFLDYIRDLKGAARTAAIQEAQKIVDAPEEEEEATEEAASSSSAAATSEAPKDEDQEMKDVDAPGETAPAVSSAISEEEKADVEAAKLAKEEKKRAAEVKSARALEVLRLLA